MAERICSWSSAIKTLSLRIDRLPRLNLKTRLVCRARGCRCSGATVYAIGCSGHWTRARLFQVEVTWLCTLVMDIWFETIPLVRFRVYQDLRRDVRTRLHSSQTAVTGNRGGKQFLIKSQHL